MDIRFLTVKESLKIQMGNQKLEILSNTDNTMAQTERIKW